MMNVLIRYRVQIIIGAQVLAILYVLNYLSITEVPIVNIPMPWGITLLLAVSIYIFYNLYHKRLVKKTQSKEDLVEISDNVPQPDSQPEKKSTPKIDIVEAFKKGKI